MAESYRGAAEDRSTPLERVIDEGGARRVGHDPDPRKERRMTGSSGADGRGVFHDDFRLSITKALGDQLAQALRSLGRAPLREESLAKLEERPGVYQLYVNDVFVYVGKADRRHKGLPGRLRNHLRKLSGRRNLALADVTFSCLYVDEDFSALAPEQLLINHYKERGGIPWNNSGFGSKDPGRRRDTTVLKKDHFDVQYPINLAAPVQGVSPGTSDLRTFLKQLKAGLPYNFRYVEPSCAADISVEVPDGPLSADEAFRLASASLPVSWQITALLNYVIMYEEEEQYKSASRHYRAGEVVDQEPEKSTAPLTPEDLGDSE
ncbi:GIY-YIG nuclease family protein [Streptomyces sp. NEAU-H22]|uniref:GIY-YIG nuclease family protein n=1 Tax=Streptomyces sp. NEAU-H22 TaxID=2994655 RepID=UPI002250CA8C|nr:GIY-YIG nuclease family protein [Streptomyces sp. NEAU-H22]MCX3286047.1 GIY-YIG nuclease family protein [Streptomyces sp. NEAU-H22]